MAELHKLTIHIGTEEKAERFMDKFVIEGDLSYEYHPADPACGLFTDYCVLEDFRIKHITDNRNLRTYHSFSFTIEFLVRLQEKVLKRIKQKNYKMNVLAEDSLSFYQ